MSAKLEKQKRKFIKDVDKSIEAKTFEILDDYFDSIKRHSLRFRLKMAWMIIFKKGKRLDVSADKT